LIEHPNYGKFVRRTSKYVAHDEDNSCKPGDLVAIVECRPISKTKSWRVVEIVAASVPDEPALEI
jgi:small subunit ribosomal protein S17